MLYYIWLSTIKGIGPATQKKLLKVFENPEKKINRARHLSYSGSLDTYTRI